MAGDSGCLMRIRLGGHSSEIFIIIPDFKFRRVYSADSRIAVFPLTSRGVSISTDALKNSGSESG
jgi:hypothetical protein